MLIERIAWVVAVVAVGGVAFFGGQQLGFRSGQENRAQATQQFFAERGGQSGAQAGAGGAQAAPGGQGGFPGGGQNVAGVVESVSGNTLVVTTADGTKQTVALAADGTVRRQVEGTIGDIKVGERVVALGQRDGDTFTARVVQIGQFGGPRPTQ